MNGRLRAGTAEVRFGWKVLLRDLEFFAKVADLLLLGFDVVVRLVCKNEIQQHEASFDEFGGMPAPVADILFADSDVDRLRNQVVDAARGAILRQ